MLEENEAVNVIMKSKGNLIIFCSFNPQKSERGIDNGEVFKE